MMGVVVISGGYVTILEVPKIYKDPYMRNNQILSACLGTPVEFNVFSSKVSSLYRKFMGYAYYNDA